MLNFKIFFIALVIAIGYGLLLKYLAKHYKMSQKKQAIIRYTSKILSFVLFVLSGIFYINSTVNGMLATTSMFTYMTSSFMKVEN